MFTAPKHIINDPSGTLLGLYDWNAVHNADHPIFLYADGDDVKTIVWSEANDATHRAGAIFAKYIKDAPETSRPVVAIFANSGTCDTQLQSV